MLWYFISIFIRVLVFFTSIIHNFRFLLLALLLYGQGSAILLRRILHFSKDIPTRILFGTLHEHGRSL